MNNYTMNFSTKTLTITKEFAANAMKPDSAESAILVHLQNICPNLKITYRTHKRTTGNSRKGLSFEKMENYIRLYDNAEELLLMFSKVKAIADIQPNKYNFVYKWFITQFPNYKEIPEFTNGKLVAKVIDFSSVANEVA